MKSRKIFCLLLLSCLVLCDSVSALCSLSKVTSAQCQELEDVRYIDTYQLHDLRAPSSAEIMSSGNFQNLTSLRHLDLSEGKITSVTKNSFAKLGFLKTLNLADNRINYIEPGAFNGLTQLHDLKLDNNNITRLPVALLSLKKLEVLDLSENPLNCDCASMKLRDVLLLRGVRISKKTMCAEPFSARDSSILKPITKLICNFEQEDKEMQGDQPAESGVENSGDANENKDEEILKEEKKVPQDPEKQDEQSSENETVPVSDPPVITTETPLSTTSIPEIPSSSLPTSTGLIDGSSISTSTASGDVATESEDVLKGVSSTSKTDLTTMKPEVPKNTGLTEETDYSEDSEESEEAEVFDKEKAIDGTPVTEPPNTLPSSTASEKSNIIIPDEGSGDIEDDGSGFDDSGLISHLPHIDFNQTSESSGEEEEDNGAGVSTTTKTSTTDGSSLWDLFNFNIWGPMDTGSSGSSSTTTTTKSTDEDLKEEQFIKVTQTPTVESILPIEEPTMQPKVLMQDEALPKNIASSSDDDVTNDIATNHRADSIESKQGMGSYFVLSALLVILVGLIATAACRGDFCRKKQKRRDVERGTELKDMQKSLLDQNSAHPKIQVSNGMTMENVPLMNSSAPPEEPKANQKSYDITPAVTNGTSRSNGHTIDLNDPVKPPRKSFSQGIEAPLNGLNPPMEDIDGPDSPCLHNGLQDNLDNGSYEADKSPLSLDTQRVKITMQENPDSVPKTPILITRLKDGENLVKAP